MVVPPYFLNNKIMAKVKSNTASTFKPKPKVSRPGVHAKTKTSGLKQSKNYQKRYRGQG
jgi:hypothetical protein